MFKTGNMFQTTRWTKDTGFPTGPSIHVYSDHPPHSPRHHQQFNPYNYLISFVILKPSALSTVFLTARPVCAEDNTSTVSLKCTIYKGDLEYMLRYNYLEKIA